MQLQMKNKSTNVNETTEAKTGVNTVLPAVYPLIDNHRWYAENGTVYNEADETVKIVLLQDNGSYSNLPNEIAMMISSALNSR
jgi:hypothetical protein